MGTHKVRQYGRESLEMNDETSWPTQQPDAQPRRESNDNQDNTKQPWGEPPPKAPRAVLGEPHQNAAQPNDTLRTTGQHNGSPKRMQSTPGKNLHQKRQRAILGRTFIRMHNPNDQQHETSERILQPTELQKQHKPVLGEPPPEPPRHHSGKTLQNAPAKPTEAAYICV
ncbi:hypothetical protein Taro_051457 [Colocasia esculenta]|uniref:Uncharacterized protein n=1 Tax=Colocasia esculenta TaxID=4460 RepID=A0A843XGM3_COLES|nr:hypothetical protein [Colocasia esculenta]